MNYTKGQWEVPLKLEDIARLSTGAVLWNAICQVIGKHATDNFHLLQNFIQTPQQLLCNFCKSVGHDECHYRSYELMMEIKTTYRMQEETQPPHQGTQGACGYFQGREQG